MSLTVCGILGAPYCGSTLLSCLLNTHPSIASVGELHHVIRETQKQEDLWAQKKGGCFFHPNNCSIFRRDEMPYCITDAHRLLAKRLASSILVDESKGYKTFEAYENAGSADNFMYVLLIKNPYEQMQSFSKHEQHRQASAARYFYFSNEAYRRAYNFIKNKQHLIFTYHSLCVFTQDVLREIAKSLQVSPERFFIDRYWEAETHPVSGNTAVYVDPKPVYYSESWIDLDPIVSQETIDDMFEIYDILKEKEILF